MQMSDSRWYIIPEPKKIVYSAQKYYLGANLHVSFYHAKQIDFDNTLDLIKEQFSGYGVKLHVKENPAPPARSRKLVVLISNKRAMPDVQSYKPFFAKKIDAEGYNLRIDDNVIVMTASDGAGLFYAFQTLFQLIDKEKGKYFVPGVGIEDWPELKIRGVHIDPHNLTPKVSAIKDDLKLFAQHKINTVIITYGDKFKYERHPKISHPHAYTKKQMREVSSLAKDLYIDFIPVVQSLGHSPNVLVNEEYAHLREGDNNITQFCPLHLGTLELFKEMAEEVMEVHDSKHFHIGADETYYRGSCEKCKKAAAKRGEIGVYTDYVSKVCKYITSKGRIPLLWDDMLCQSPSKVKELNPNAVICYWDYCPVDAKNPFVCFRNDWYCDKKYWENKKWWGVDFINSGRCKDISELSNEKMKYYKPYFTKNDDFRYFEPYPFYNFYKDSGHPVVGFPAAIGGEYGYISPNYIKRFNNVIRMIDLVAENNGPGVISTSWSEMLIPNELIRYAFIASAEYCWSPKSITLEKFQEKFINQYFMCQDSDILCAMYLIAKKDPPLCYRSEDKSDVKERGWFAEKETLKEMLDVRIKKFCTNPDPDKAVSELRQMLDDAQKAAAILGKSRKNIKKNRHTFNHLVLAACMLKHKARQALLFMDIETALKNKVKSNSAVAKTLLRQLSALEREIKTLIFENRALFEKTYMKSSVEDRNRTIFEGELEKTEEYQSCLKSKKP